MVCPIGGLPKCPKFGCSGHTFGGCWLLLILMMVSTQKYVQLIMPYFPGAKRRGNMYYFVASKDDCGWFCCSNAATVV